MNVKKRYFLSKKDVKRLKKELEKYFENVDEIIPKKGNVEIVITDTYEIVLANKEPIIFKLDDCLFPTLKLLQKTLPSKNIVVVDMGAIKFLINGADVMSPGIVKADSEIEEGDVVFVVDESHKKPICVGIALMSGDEMINSEKGKAIKNVHYVGDAIWNFKG
ncbi:PUA domain containing protein [Methanocaldococcus vulcanius M7]|uniref:PUA domain containing protein n=1 Tax=Methanocaldococcus vulcanius (strain ATCC 700851 / DSM 12094 / M7) TaxID=579137 RepID=C9RGQ5_METVM|nr:RNA-binding protein [Methanocaldococcus vulcanius]ACX72757.1 PUA domain containing protein [Methanocaldococcus vulcanius M7]